MALQYSGSISMGQINVELGRGASVPISLDAAENGTYATINTNSANYPSGGNPASMSEWYGYNHTAVAPAIPIFWNFYTGVCTGDYLQLFKNGVLMVNATVGPLAGNFTALNGDLIDVYGASGIKGTGCDNVSIFIYQNGSEIGSSFAPGYSNTVNSNFNVYAGSDYTVNGYVGFVPA